MSDDREEPVRDPGNPEPWQPAPPVQDDAPDGEAPPPPEPRTAGFVFSGTASGYFRIWIVNICLSLVTLGIYSAWAKVRTGKYLRSHTSLDGMPFSYDADPLAILRGRVVATVLFAAWTGLSYISPFAQLALLPPLAFLMPWLVVASLRFNARVSSYRNVGFRFHGDYTGALEKFLGLPLLAGLTGGLLAPWVIHRQRTWEAEKTTWGDRRLELRAQVSDFYAAYLPLIIAGFLFVILLFVGIGMSAFGEEGAAGDAPMAVMLIPVLSYGLLLLASLVTYAATLKCVLGHLWVGDQAHLECRIHPGRYAWIIASNSLLALVTVGMLYPWGEVRRLRYLAGLTSVTGVESFETVTGPRGGSASATGEEIANAFDVEVGF